MPLPRCLLLAVALSLVTVLGLGAATDASALTIKKARRAIRAEVKSEYPELSDLFVDECKRLTTNRVRCAYQGTTDDLSIYHGKGYARQYTYAVDVRLTSATCFVNCS